MPKAEYDKQGKYFFHLSKLAGWDQKRIDALLVKRYQTTHWNALTTQQKSALIATMQAYAMKAEKDRLRLMPGIRQNIMATAAKNGYDLDWLHGRMNEWGYGISLRMLGYSQLLQLKRDLINTINNIKGENHETN
jgi:hypothetical protein